MKKRILITTKNGFKLYGDYYETDTDLKLDEQSKHTEQDLKEYTKAAYKYRLNESELDHWDVQICTSK